ncbi:hypothetical protein HK102_008774, partial [Quaeritorhiza haematococci]
VQRHPRSHLPPINKPTSTPLQIPTPRTPTPHLQHPSLPPTPTTTTTTKTHPWNVSLFHYRNYGGDVGKVMVGIQVPPPTSDEFEVFLRELRYPYVEETENGIYKEFLRN